MHPKSSWGGGGFATLEPGQRFLLWAIRAWVSCCKADILPSGPVRRAFAEIRILEGASALETALMWIARGTNRPLGIHCPNCPALGEDEELLLEAAAAAQHRDFPAARDILNRILPLPIVERALGPLSNVGLLLALEGIDLPVPGMSVDGRHPRTDAAVPLATFH